MKKLPPYLKWVPYPMPSGHKVQTVMVVDYRWWAGPIRWWKDRHDAPKRPPSLSPEERKKRADARNRGELDDGPGGADA